MRRLPYKVECKSFLAFFETIAAFDCQFAADAYVKNCASANPQYTYRVKKG